MGGIYEFGYPSLGEKSFGLIVLSVETSVWPPDFIAELHFRRVYVPQMAGGLFCVDFLSSGKCL